MSRRRLFREVARVVHDGDEISAGAIACNSRALFVGTYSGWAAFDLQSLACTWCEPDLLPTHCNVHGVQLDGDNVILLGNTRSQTHEAPLDWGNQLFVGRVGRSARPVVDLPPGNWRMVRRIVGDRVYLYDVSEGQGIACVQPSGPAWGRPVVDLKRVLSVGDFLLCIGNERLVVLAHDGRLICERENPESTGYEWTTAGAGPASGITLGGFNRQSKAFALALLLDPEDPSPVIVEHPLDRVFDHSRTGRAWEDECCGVDIFHVARIESLSPTTLLVALGGGGEELGACQGAAALGLVRIDRPDDPWQTEVIDDLDGISGLLRIPSDHRILVDLCGDIRVYEAEGGQARAPR